MIAELDSQACTLSFDLNASTSAGSLSGSASLYLNSALDNGSYSTAVSLGAFTIPTGSGKVTIPISAAQSAGIKYGGEVVLFFTQNTATGNPSISIGAMQLELGNIAQPFERYSLPAELHLCRYYYRKSYLQSVAPGATLTSGSGAVLWTPVSSGAAVTIFLGEPMRAAPTMTIYDQAGTSGKVSYYSVGWLNGGATLNIVANSDNMATFQWNGSGNPPISFDYTASAEL
jgi:hypothetical protein